MFLNILNPMKNIVMNFLSNIANILGNEQLSLHLVGGAQCDIKGMGKVLIGRFRRSFGNIGTNRNSSPLKLVAQTFLLKPGHLVRERIYICGEIHCVVPDFIVSEIAGCFLFHRRVVWYFNEGRTKLLSETELSLSFSLSLNQLYVLEEQKFDLFMKKSIFSNVTVTVLSDSGKEFEFGKLTNGSILQKTDDHFVVMPCAEAKKRTAHNPLVYEGKFFSSRQKQNGTISLHALVNDKTDLYTAYLQACKELDEFFAKLEALV